MIVLEFGFSVKLNYARSLPLQKEVVRGTVGVGNFFHLTALILLSEGQEKF